MAERSQPYRCERCVSEGQYVGMLRFPGDPIPKCRLHGEMTEVKVKK